MQKLTDPFISYAQNREDVLLWRALGALPRGFYVDIGAQHPVNDSVTKAFYDKGWSGINIEPDPAWFPVLRDQRPRDINLNLAVSNRSDTALFWCVNQTGLSTLDPALALSHEEKGLQVHKIEVEVRPLFPILQAHVDGDIHFLKIDVEGHEREVLESCDFGKVRPWIVVVEATAPNSTTACYQTWEPILTTRNYACVHFDGLNRYYLAEERADLRRHFSHPPCVFDNFRSNRERELELEREANVETITRLQNQLQLSEKDRAERLTNIHRLTDLLQESERDRAARLESIHHLSALLGQAENEKTAGSARIRELESLLAQIGKRPSETGSALPHKL